MSDPQQDPTSAKDLPQARVERRRWHDQIVWVVPLVAAMVAGYLVYNRLHEFGTTITIRFRDGDGLRVGETPLKYRGVFIGEVKSIELSRDRQYVEVVIRLRRSADSIARQDSDFWIVRPELGVGNITGLGTIITGPHIEVLPGEGAPTKEFIGLPNAPLLVPPKVLRITLLGSRLGGLKAGSPVFYRGVEVGIVQDTSLHTNATAIVVRLAIQHRYANLVRSGSKFWNVSGVDVKLGLFRGAEVNFQSPKSLVGGGIAFATKDTDEPPATDGLVFPLEEEPKKEWLEWRPQIAIPPEPSDTRRR
jgi:paraquat-inducible protein B